MSDRLGLEERTGFNLGARSSPGGYRNPAGRSRKNETGIPEANFMGLNMKKMKLIEGLNLL